jgi:hypothetical protein
MKNTSIKPLPNHKKSYHLAVLLYFFQIPEALSFPQKFRTSPKQPVVSSGSRKLQNFFGGSKISDQTVTYLDLDLRVFILLFLPTIILSSSKCKPCIQGVGDS